MTIFGDAFQQRAQGKIRINLKDDDEVRIPRTAFYFQHLKVNLSLFVLQMKTQSLREIK